jgi:hypothetical protein
MIRNTPNAMPSTAMFGMVEHQHDHEHEGRREHREVHGVLALVDDGPLRQPFLKLPRGHQASGEDEEPEDDLDAEHRGVELVEVVVRQVVVRGADQRRGQAAEGVGERDPLRHRGHRHQQAERHADGRSDQRGDGDQDVALGRHVRPEEGGHDRDAEPELAGQDAAAGGGRRRHPLERHGEAEPPDQVGQVDPVHPVHG